MTSQEESYKSPERLDLAQRIRHWREQSGLRKIDLARALGVEPSMVSKWERASTIPGIENNHRIAEVCGVSMTRFWGPLKSPTTKVVADELG